MEDKKFLKIFSPIVLFLFLLLSKGYFYYILNIDLNNLSKSTNNIINFIYIITSLLISIIFYLKLKKKTELKKHLIIFLKGIGAVTAYFVLSELQLLPILLSGLDYEVMPLISKVIYLISYEIFMIAIICLILNKEISQAIEDIKKNHQEYFKKYFKYWLLGLVIMTTSNLIINVFNGGAIAGNEETIRDMFSKAPVYMFISAVFFAPLLEELVFRQGLRNIFSNDKVFIIISGIVFGGLHVVGNVNAWYDLLYLIPYCTPGFIFAYILTKTNNIFVPAGLHFLHNGLIMSLQILLLVLGQI